MKLTKHFFAASLSMTVAGCSGLGGKQPAAPVYDPYYSGSRTPQKQPEVEPKIIKPIEKEVVTTTPLDTGAPPSWATRQVEPVRATQQSPVVIALLTDAERNSGAGNLDAAVATLERGLRIEPRNATLVYKLAEVRLKQEKPRLAEGLAKKAALLAGSDRVLKRKSWLLIAQSRRQQGDSAGAAQAVRKAERF